MKNNVIDSSFITIIEMCLVLLAAGTPFPASAQNSPSREYQVKAAFLYHFTKFVEWPNTSFDNPEAPFIIAISGIDPFGTLLDETVAGETVKDHPIVVQRYETLEEIKSCHMLYVNTNDTSGLKEKLVQLRSSVLTVSDIADFNNLGGMIRLLKRDNKIKIVINPDAVKAAELEISSKLLNVADIFVAYR